VAREVVEKAAELRGQTRRTIGTVINEEEVRQKLRDLIDQIMELNGLAWGHCPNCKKKVQVEVPDLKGRVDAFIKLLEQAEGKPQDGENAGTTVVVEFIWPGVEEPHEEDEGSSPSPRDRGSTRGVPQRDHLSRV
jgi:hypothetical protein